MPTSRIVFRADASPLLGGGHVMRCLTLARALAAGGAETATTVAYLAGSPFLVREADAEPGRWPAQVREVWPSGADVAVVDHYALGAEAERLLRRASRLVMAIDDLAARLRMELLLDRQPPALANDYFSAMARVGLGRNLTALLTPTA